jgi:hypothetical protein
MQLGRAAYLTVLEITDDDDAVVDAPGRILDQEIVVHDAVEPVTPAGRIETHKVVAQQRHFTWPEHTYVARQPVAPGNLYFGHFICLLVVALEEAFSPYTPAYMVRRSIAVKSQQLVEVK